MNSCAPILIPTLNRFEHFERCINSLRNNSYAQQTDLFIALDAPFRDSQKKGYYCILKFLDELSGFKSITIFKRERNFGVRRNIDTARNEIFLKYDRLIFSEDDNFFAPNFLDYINKGLEIYENNEQVYAVCGYNFPIEMPSDLDQNFYFWKGFSAWGCGYWRNKFYSIDRSIDSIEFFLSKYKNIRLIEKTAAINFLGLLTILRTGNITGDILINMNMVKNNMYCVFPVKSKVRNYGHDGTGEHCGEMINDLYSTQDIDLEQNFNFSEKYRDCGDNVEINKVLSKHFNMSILRRLYSYGLYIFLNLNLFCKAK
jgi:hypothetical protein